MANVKGRVKAQKSASTRKKSKNESLAGKNDTTVRRRYINKEKYNNNLGKDISDKEPSSDDYTDTETIKRIEEKIKSGKDNIVMRRPSDVKLLTTQERVQCLLQHGHLFKGKFPVRPPGKYVPSKKRLAAMAAKIRPPEKDRLISRSGRIKKKNKPDLQLLDNILKSELLIDDSAERQTRSQTEKNPTKPSNNNNEKISNQNSTSTSENKSDDNSSTTKQMTPDSGVVLTLELFQCDYCKKSFSSKSSIRRHIYIHLDWHPYSCPHCSKQFRHHVNRRIHIKKKHNNLSKEPDKFVCHICDKVFTLKENLSLHLASHVSNENSYKCIYCDKKFSYQLQLNQHEKQHLVTGRYQCTVCNLSYGCRNRLAMHVKSHLKIKDYVCQYCGKDFLRMNSMRRHVQICHSGHRIQCPICKKNLKGHLTEHMRTHEKRRPHECPECGQCFTQSTQLNVHRRSHSGARPYECRICDRKFSHSNALMLHIRRHTGEKPFPCAVCPLSFSQLPHMKAHMRKIHGKENPYKCPKCDQFFKLKVQLENHAKLCKAKNLSQEERIPASSRTEEIEVESVMSLSRMRFLLALLFSMILSKERLKFLGFNKRLIDDLLVDSLEAMGHASCVDENQSPLSRLKTNIELLLKHTVPKEQIEKFQRENKTLEELLEILTDDKKKKD